MYMNYCHCINSFLIVHIKKWDAKQFSLHSSMHRIFVKVQHLLPCWLEIRAQNTSPVNARWKQVNQVQISILVSVANWEGDKR